MIIYQDILSGDELFTDACKPKLNDDETMYTFQTKQVTVKEGEDYHLAGANPSAEETQEDTEVTTRTDFDFVIANRLQSYPIASKKDLQGYFKGYFKALRAHWQESGMSEEEIKNMEKVATKLAMEFIPKYDNLSLYRGESLRDDSLCIIVEWNEDGLSGTAYAFKCGVKEVKY